MLLIIHLSKAMKRNPSSFGGEQGEREHGASISGSYKYQSFTLKQQIPKATKIPVLFCYVIKSLKNLCYITADYEKYVSVVKNRGIVTF